MFEDGEDDGDDGVEDGGLQGTNLEIITLQQSDIQVQGGPKKGLWLFVYWIPALLRQVKYVHSILF